jgi:formylmethanofuran dehydrogenase subunit E
MREKEESTKERRNRWMEREARKADEQKPKQGVCAICGKEVIEGEYIEYQGRILCADCYLAELEESVDIGTEDGCGAG